MLVSVALFVIAARLSTLRFGAMARASSVGRLALEGARFLFYIGLPYAALLTGVFAPRDVGLQGSPAPDLLLGWTPEAWTRALGHAAVLGAFTLIALAMLIGQVRRADGYPPTILGIDRQPLAIAIREAVYAETHWSFYRALPMVLWGDARWAALVGLAPVALEALLAGHAHAGADRIRLSEVLLASLSAAYFALTGGNIWAAIVLQIVVRASLTGFAFAGQRMGDAEDIIV